MTDTNRTQRTTTHVDAQPGEHALVGCLHDAGELTAVTPAGGRVKHRAALLITFHDQEEMQRAIRQGSVHYEPRGYRGEQVTE